MKISKKLAIPALGALCLSVVVSLSPHQSGHLPSAGTAGKAGRAGHHALVLADPGGGGDPGWDGQPNGSNGGGDDPGWD